MTTFVGKDVTIKYDVDADNTAEALALAQEFTVEVDNGLKEVKEIGDDDIQEFNWVGVAVSGTLSIVPTAGVSGSDLGDLFDLVHPSSGNPSGERAAADDDLLLEFDDGTGVYTFTITGVAFGSFSFSIGLEEIITLELPFIAKNISYSYA